MTDEDREPEWRGVADLARDLMLAREEQPGRGRAVFLVGAGCSVSAGIPAAQGVARLCAVYLARCYSQGGWAGTGAETDADEALAWLVDQGHVRKDVAHDEGGKARWGELYPHFFEGHLKAPNQQRSLISSIVDTAGGKLNWAHACLGELVRLRYAHSVLTTNFDQLVLTGMFRTGLIPVVADGMFALNRIVAKPLVPQVVHLHGSMHTYNLRNSRRSMAETREDARAVTMMNGILQQCDVLVVVGYAGGEEGVMDLLLSAAEHHEQLVIYWVAYERGAEKLSRRARALLMGENKFAIEGGEADKFFGDLMAALELGQPAWVADPLGELARQAGSLERPKANPEVSILIDAFQQKVATGTEAVGRWHGDGRKLDAAGKRAEGDFAAARAALADVDLTDDPEAARLHALNALSLFEEDATGERRGYLDAAITEFATLVEATGGEERLDNLISLIEAKLDLYELDGDPDLLREVIRTVTEDLEGAGARADGRLLYYRALAHHRLAEAAGEAEEELRQAEEDYRASLASDPKSLVLEVREGLAATLQVLGRKHGDPDRLREAVRLFGEVADLTRRNVGSPEEGGLLYNLSGAMIEMMPLASPSERARMLEEVSHLLQRAEDAFERAGNFERLAEVQARREQIAASRTRAASR